MKRFFKSLLRHLPKNHLGDYLYHLVFFLVAHRRIPRRQSGLFNDYLFFFKTGQDFDCAHRQFVSDKDLVKIYYKGVLGADLAPRTLAKFHSLQDLVATKLPAPCVIKPAHLSGCIYRDGSTSDLAPGELAQISRWFEANIYRDISRERNYRSLRASVICEELVADRASVRDYKIFCYKGKPRAIQVDVDRHCKHKRRMYTVNWQPLPYTYNKPLAEVEPEPAQLAKTLSIAESLAADFEFIRVDVYLSADRVWLGELTSVPENAHGRFESLSAELAFSKLILSPGAFEQLP